MRSGAAQPVYLLLPFGLGLLGLLFGTLFTSMVHLYSDSPLCVPGEFPGPNNLAYRGWQLGLCLTEEQVWCRANGNRDLGCNTADCRAEEIRLALWQPSSEVPEEATDGQKPPRAWVYAECGLQVWDFLEAINPGDRKWLGWPKCGPCVPADDPRSKYLPECNATVAACRSRFYRPWNSSTPMAEVVCPALNSSLPDDLVLNARCDATYVMKNGWVNEDPATYTG